MLLWTPRAALVAGCCVALVLLWAGLVLTLSQSSFTALLVGLAVLGALRWGTRRAAAVVAAFALAGALVVLAAPGAVGLDGSTDDVTSGRRRSCAAASSSRATGRCSAGRARSGPSTAREGLQRARVGGVAHDPDHGRRRAGRRRPRLYLALVASRSTLLLRGAAARSRGAVAAAFVALVVHTLLYAAFLEDPLAWALLAPARRWRREP